jgi:diamine N-acetyltransferase
MTEFIEVLPGEKLQLKQLSKICSETFYATFAAVSDAEHMEAYMAQAFSESQLSSEIANPESWFYIIRHNENLCGYFKINSGHAQTELKPENYLEIQRIYLYPEYHGKGIAHLALIYIINLAKSKMKQMLWLGVAEDNFRAYRFYEKHGFIPNGIHVFDFAGDMQSDICMELRLD